jgi:AcrR family transcriptional regulator
MPRRFQRARKPEEKEIRREAILKAARRLMREGDTAGLSLTALARQSGVSKPNIYRYFESREEVLFHVWVEEIRDLSARLQAAFEKVPVGDFEATAQAIVGAFSGQPRLCELLSIAAPTLERNMSAEAVANAKRTLIGLTYGIAQLLHGRLPSIALEDCGWMAGTLAIYVAGLWPTAHPGEVASEVMARPEFAPLKSEFDRDLLRLVRVLLAGLPRKA